MMGKCSKRRTESRGRIHVLGRAAIAMAAVRSGACDPPGKVFGHSRVRPPTDVMQSRPYLRGGAARGHAGMVTGGHGELMPATDLRP